MTAKNWMMLACVALTLGAAGCGSDSESGESPKVFATFNAGLAPGFEDYATERAPKVIDQLALEAKSLDFLCVQEFWREDDFSALAAAVQAELPTAIRLPPKPGTSTGSCPAEKIEPLRSCGKSHCDGLTASALQDCVAESCESLVPTDDSGCFSCLLGELAKGSVIDDIADACAGTGSPEPNADPAIFGGSYDIGVLTGLPVLEQGHCELPAYMVRVAAQYVRVKGNDDQELNVFCTHLTSSIGAMPYGGQNTDWETEHDLEVDGLLQCIADKAQGGPVVVMGDLNASLAEGNLAAEWPTPFEKLIASGLKEVATGQEPPLCTLCPENTFRSDDSKGKRVDHILVRDVELTHAERFMLGTVTVTAGGSNVETSFADHYGLKAY